VTGLWTRGVRAEFNMERNSEARRTKSCRVHGVGKVMLGDKNISFLVETLSKLRLFPLFCPPVTLRVGPARGVRQARFG
jgi:hypothetical protein